MGNEASKNYRPLIVVYNNEQHDQHSEIHSTNMIVERKFIHLNIINSIK